MKSNLNNPKGNPNFSGGPGSGRKSIKGRKTGRKTAKEEHERYMNEHDLLYSPQEIHAVIKKYNQLLHDIKAGIDSEVKMSVREIMLAKELSGNDKLISKHYEKVVPDKIELPGPEGKPIPILQILVKYENKNH